MIRFTTALGFTILAMTGCVTGPSVDAGIDGDVLQALDVVDRDQTLPISDSMTADRSDTAIVCSAQQVLCGGGCTNTADDQNNCGACGVLCSPSTRCRLGRCENPCSMGQSLCGAGPMAMCVATRTDVANCGNCGRRCPAGERCGEGVCLASCPAPHTACGLGCADLQTDRNHCGMCGSACSVGQVCAMGVCSCPESTPDLCGMGPGATCVNRQTDAQNCGACAQACPIDQYCLRGVGGIACGACTMPNVVCGMGATRRCVNITSEQHCGLCDNNCGGNGTCTAGACVPRNTSPNTAIPLVVALTGARVSTTGNNQGGAMEAGQCAPHAVYYSVTVVAPAILYVDTFGSAVNTHVGVRPSGSITTLGCNDDRCGTPQSQTTLVVAPGTHLIEVAGGGGAVGSFVLNVAALPASNGGRNEVVVADSTRRWARGTTGTATNLPIEVPAEGPRVAARAADVHYYVTCPSEPTRTLHVSTCESAFNTVLCVVHGGGVAAPTTTTDDDGGDSLCNTPGAHDSNIGAAHVPSGAGIHALYVTGLANATGLYSLHYSLGCANNHVEVAMRCRPVQSLESDVANCGAAGRVCPPDQQCITGVCVARGEDTSPPALTYALIDSPGRDLTAIGAAVGGTSFSDSCPSGQVLIGVQSSETAGIAVTEIVGHVAGICARVGVIGRTGTAPQRITFTRVLPNLGSHGASVAAQLRSRDLLCPTGYVVVGVAAATDSMLIHSLALRCAPLTVEENGAGPFVVTRGTSVLVGAVGGEGSAFSQSGQECAPNEVANGMLGRTDRGLLSLGLRCTSARVLQLRLNSAMTTNTGTVGGGVGFVFTIDCPAANVLGGVNVGVTDRLDGALTRLRAACRRITGFNGGGPFGLSTGTSSPTGVPQGAVLVPAANVECAPGNVPVGFAGALNRSNYVAGVRFLCASLQHSSMNTSLVDAPETPQILAPPNRTFGAALRCPANSLPTGIFGRAGAIVDYLGLRCTPFVIR